MSLAEKYHLSKDDIVIKKRVEGSRYDLLVPILPECLPDDVAIYGGLDRIVYISNSEFACNLIVELLSKNENMIDGLDDEIILEFFDNGFLKNLYFSNGYGVEFSSYNLDYCFYSDLIFNMDEDKFNLFFRDIKHIGGVVIGKGSVFETKNVSDYETACLLCDYLCQLHNNSVDLIFDSYLSQDVL